MQLQSFERLSGHGIITIIKTGSLYNAFPGIWLAKRPWYYTIPEK